MISLLLSLALADDRVKQVEWAQRFELKTPHPYQHSAQPHPIQQGWLVQLRVDAPAQRPLQIGVPLLWVGDDVAVRTNWGSECAVVWVPGEHDLRKEPIFYGSTTLPERVDAERRALDHSQAADRGWGPKPVLELSTHTQVFANYTELMAFATDRAKRCEATTER